MTAVCRTPAAEEDLIELWCRIARDNLQQADRYLDTIETKLQLLATAPRIGRIWDETQPAIRVLPFDNYMLFYRDSGRGIELIRVIHGARDVASLFDDELREWLDAPRVGREII
jgi:toxin ParE1/3/4